MKRVLLIFDDYKELAFFEENLSENKFQISKSPNLEDATIKIKTDIPDLIVVNTSNEETDLELLNSLLLKDSLKHTIFISPNYFGNTITTTSKNHLVIQSIRPKVLLSLIRGVMNNEKFDWLPTGVN
jgi:DNA-binding NtrC family response regulator